MRFYTGLTLLATAGAVLGKTDCNNGPFQSTRGWPDPKYNGDVSDICATQWGIGRQVVGMEGWADGYAINGIRWFYDDGSDSGIVGRNWASSDDRHINVKWDKADTISEFRVWGNQDAKALGRLQIKINGKIVVDIGGVSENNM